MNDWNQTTVHNLAQGLAGEFRIHNFKSCLTQNGALFETAHTLKINSGNFIMIT
jgi:hypothetical protein